MRQKVNRRAWTALIAVSAVSAMSTAAICAPTDPGSQRFRLGTFEVIALRDATDAVPNDGKVFGTNVDPAAVGKVLSDAGVAPGAVPLSVNVLAVRAGAQVMLFDTGLGPKAHGALLGSLAAAGIAPAAVTDIFITHSHGDHVGGLTAADGTLAFPAARIHLAAQEWQAMQARADAKDLVALIGSRVQTFRPGEAVQSGVRSVALIGHTPGHVGYELTSGGVKLLDIGDTAHSAIVSLARPAWHIGFDADPRRGAAVRQATLGRIAASKQWVFAPHFPYPGIGTVMKTADGFRWSPATGDRLTAAK